MWLVLRPTRQDGPNDPGIFICQRDRDDIRVPPITHPFYPQAPAIRFAARLTQNCTRTMNQQGSSIPISSFANPKEARVPTAGSLFRDKSEPGCKLPSILEACSVTDCSNKRCSRYWPNPFDLADASAHLIRSEQISDAL